MESTRRSFDVLDLFLVSIRFWKTLVILPLLLAVATYLIVSAEPARYRATATVHFLPLPHPLDTLGVPIRDVVHAEYESLPLLSMSMSAGERVQTISVLAETVEAARAGLLNLIANADESRMAVEPIRDVLSRQKEREAETILVVRDQLKNLEERGRVQQLDENESKSLPRFAQQLTLLETEHAYTLSLLDPARTSTILNDVEVQPEFRRSPIMFAAVAAVVAAIATIAASVILYVASALFGWGEVKNRWRSIQDGRDPTDFAA